MNFLIVRLFDIGQWGRKAFYEIDKLFSGIDPALKRKIMIRINIVVVLIISAILQVSASSYAQKITLSKSNAKLITIIKAIQAQSEYDFVYSNRLIKSAHNIDISVSNAQLVDVLDQCFKNQPFTYIIENKTIVIKEKEVEKTFFSWNVLITGTVKDSKGEPLPGVSIKVKGKQTSTVTDANGRYSISVTDNNDILVFSYIGFVTQEIAFGNRLLIDVKMQEGSEHLNEIVVVGYGTQKKVNLTGAVSVIDSKIIENRPVTNVLGALQGAASGVIVTRAGGQPGKESYALQIRGLSSVNGSSPLYVVDGAPGSISTLNPNDIASISVLKDAAAASIYGARAAGGVVLITTKNGAAGKTSIQYSGIYGQQKVIRLPQRLHSWQEAEMANIAAVNAGSAAPYTDEILGYLKDPNYNYRISPLNPGVYDYFYDRNPITDLIRGTTPSQQHNLSVSGGKDNTKYLMSLGYFKQQGMFKVGPDNTDRINARFNYSTRFSRSLSADIRLSYTKIDVLSPNRSTSGDQQLIYDIYKLRSTYPIYLPGSNDTKYAAISGDNVYGLLKDGGNIDAVSHYFNPVVSLKADSLVKGLTLTAVYAPSLLSNNQEAISRTVPVWNVNAINNYMNNPNAYTDAYLLQVQNNIQFLVDYDFKIKTKNTFHFLLGSSFEDYNYRRTAATAKALSSNDLFTISLGDPKQASNTQDIQTWALFSYFGRLNYNFDDRFLFEFNMRYDGSSKLAPQNRWELFPSVSGAWRISNEKWFKNNISFFDELKLRGSWGRLGNSDGVIGNYDYIALINNGAVYPFNNQINNSFYQNNLASPSKTWETIESSNIGLDVSILKNRLSFSGDYYVKRNKDMLAPLQVSSVIGVTPSTYNVADLKTWGWEVSVQWKDRISSKFNYWVNGRLSDDQNKILKYDGRSAIASGVNTIIEGMPYNSIFGYQAEGYFQTNEEVAQHAFQNNKTGAGDIKYKDIDGNNVISGGLGRLDNHGDLIYLGNTLPRYNFGFDFGFQWNGLDFSAFFQGVGKRNILLDSYATLPFMEAWRQPWQDNLDYWTPQNPNARYPRLYLGGTQNTLNSTHWIANSAYLRLKNLQIGYTLPQKLTKKVKLDKVRIYFTGEDLWEITKMWNPYYDPETPTSTGYLYPLFRNYSIGLNLNF